MKKLNLLKGYLLLASVIDLVYVRVYRNKDYIQLVQKLGFLILLGLSIWIFILSFRNRKDSQVLNISLIIVSVILIIYSLWVLALIFLGGNIQFGG